MDIIVILGVGIVIGLYTASQISEHINRKTRREKFLKNMEDFDNRHNLK
jgi:hypothetical protein